MKILVGFCNGIGNFLIYTSAIKALSTLGTVDLMMSDSWKDRGAIQLIAQNIPFINDIKGYPSQFKNSEWDKTYFTFHTIAFDDFFVRTHSVERFSAERYTAWADSYLHERDYYYEEIRKQFGYKGPIYPQFMPVARELPIFLYPGVKIVVANGWAREITNGWKRKMWPHFQEFLSLLGSFYGDVAVYALGGAEDYAWGEECRVPNVAYFENLCGKLNILETARVIQEADFGIYNDSSCMHIADALRRPGIALFGATLVSKNGPLNGTITTVRSPLNCAPCQGYSQYGECDHWEQCMDKIDVGLIMAIVRKSLTFR